MELTIISDGPWVLDGANDFIAKQIHLVCIAVNALTTYNVYTTAVGGIPNEEAAKYAEIVNIKNETGTLYPRLNMTIVPLTIYGDRNDFGNDVIMKKHILDCLDSNEKYIKSPTLIFALERRFDFDMDLALKTLNS